MYYPTHIPPDFVEAAYAFLNGVASSEQVGILYRYQQERGFAIYSAWLREVNQSNKPQLAFPAATQTRPVLIERTAKRWKALDLLAAIFFILGLASCSGPVLLFSIIIWIVAEFGAWWENG